MRKRVLAGVVSSKARKGISHRCDTLCNGQPEKYIRAMELRVLSVKGS